MNLYRLTLNIDDEIQTETHEEAWIKFRERVTSGYYGPTEKDVEFLQEVVVEEAAASGE